jgi:hypothetical protein
MPVSGDQKMEFNQKMAEPTQSDERAITLSEVDFAVSLRVIADRLEAAKTPQALRTHKYDLLLGYLRSGTIVAHVNLPGLLSSPLNVPAEYWQGVRSSQMRSLVRNRSTGRLGRFRIRIKDVGKALVDCILAELETRTDLDGALARLQRESILLRLPELYDTRVETFIMDSEWKRFSAEAGIETDVIVEKSKRGRPQFEHPDLLYLEIAALLYGQLSKVDRAPTYESVAKSVEEQMRKRPKTPPPPSVSTIMGFMAKSPSGIIVWLSKHLRSTGF